VVELDGKQQTCVAGFEGIDVCKQKWQLIISVEVVMPMGPIN
jgi:hypothetical protein